MREREYSCDDIKAVLSRIGPEEKSLLRELTYNGEPGEARVLFDLLYEFPGTGIGEEEAPPESFNRVVQDKPPLTLDPPAFDRPDVQRRWEEWDAA